MKKIGIITVQKAPNYGAELQCYALYKALGDMGYQCEVIDLCRPYHKDFIGSWKYKVYSSVKRYSFKYFWITTRPIRSWIKEHILRKRNLAKEFIRQNKSVLMERERKFESFEHRISFSRKYRSIAELYRNPPQYDIYMTGSDQLWNPTQPYCLEPYFLTFVNNGGKRVSYATSIGVSSLSENVAQDFKKWLASYDRISVREVEARNILQSFTDKDIEVFADPTFLVNVEHWKEMAVRPAESDYVFLFTLGYNDILYRKAQEYALSCGKTLVYRANDYRDYPSKTDAVARLDLSPEEWLGYILYSDMVVTNSFHGCVFSILFHKQFRVMSTTNRGSRIFNLLDLCGCKDCYLETNDAVTDVAIDYHKVDETIMKERTKATTFLRSL